MAADDPTTTAGHSSETNPRLQEAIAEFLAAFETGARPDREELVSRYPDVAPELEDFIDSHVPVESVRGRPGDSVVAVSSFPTDRRIGDYVIQREIGRGGMGVVFEARQESLGRRVAIKVISAGLVPDAKAVQRFMSEARITSRIDHPGICTVYDAGVAKGVPYIAMQYVEGKTLADKILEQRRAANLPAFGDAESLDVGESAQGVPGLRDEVAASSVPCEHVDEYALIIEKSARALHVAHELGFIHRDVKPSNIMVTERGEPVLLDFGLAREMECSIPGFTLSREAPGTPAYMSPEQIKGSSAKLDRRTDVYSLGATLFECLTSRPPFVAPTREGLFRAILRDDPPNPRRLNPRISPELKVVIDTALEKDLSRRYRTALDFAEELRRVREYEPICARPPSATRRFIRWTQRNPVLATSVISLFLLLATGLGGSLWFLEKVNYEKGKKEQALQTVQEQKDDLARQLARADGLRLTARSTAMLPTDPGLALLLAIEGARRAPGLQANNALIVALQELREVRTFSDHGYTVNRARFSPDGLRVLTSSLDNAAHVWDIASGREIHRFEDYNAVAGLTPRWNGARVLTGSADNRVRIWNTETGEELAVLRDATIGQIGPNGRRVVTISLGGTVTVWDARVGVKLGNLPVDGTSELEFSGNGRFLTTVSSDKALRLWDLRTMKQVLQLSAWGGPPLLVFSPDSRSIVTASGDRETARVRDAATGRVTRVLEPDERAVTSVDYGPDDRVLTSRSDVVIWNARTGEKIHVLEGPASGIRLVSTVFSPDATRVLSLAENAEWSDTAWIWNAETGTGPIALRGHQSRIRGAAFSPDGRKIVTFADEKPVRVWDARSGELLWVLRGHRDAVTCAEFSPDGRRVVTGSLDRTARIWDVEGELPIRLRSHGGRLIAGGYAPDGTRVLAASEDGTIRTWDTTTGKTLSVVQPGEGALKEASFSQNGRLVLTLAADHRDEVRIADTASGVEVARFEMEGILSATFGPSGNYALSRFAGGKTKIWHVESGDEIVSFSCQNVKDLAPLRPVLTDSIASASFSPDGTRVLVVYERAVYKVPERVPSIHRTTRIHDARTGDELLVLGKTLVSIDRPRAHLPTCFSPDGARVLTTGEGGVTRVWDARDGRDLFALRESTRRLVSVSFSGDSSRVVTVSADAVRLWDADTGKEFLTVHANRECGPWVEARLSPDGRSLLAIGARMAMIWPMDLVGTAIEMRPRDLTAHERQQFEIHGAAGTTR